MLPILLPRPGAIGDDASPPPGPRIDAACFGAMGAGFLCDHLLCYPRPCTASRSNGAGYIVMVVDVWGCAFLC